MLLDAAENDPVLNNLESNSPYSGSLLESLEFDVLDSLRREYDSASFDNEVGIGRAELALEADGVTLKAAKELGRRNTFEALETIDMTVLDTEALSAGNVLVIDKEVLTELAEAVLFEKDDTVEDEVVREIEEDSKEEPNDDGGPDEKLTTAIEDVVMMPLDEEPTGIEVCGTTFACSVAASTEEVDPGVEGEVVAESLELVRELPMELER